ncbi:MAG: FKBP-type peptidyl-prolyl cis-trans isomerase [Bacteroidaceae bacterium]|nr:FKBP-type peptidyl-prolyl cis-trans isomerase [Bacteroidaceae bacterium]
MKKLTNILITLAILAGFMACQEVKEAGEFDNWKERNTAFADSLNSLTSGREVITASESDAMELGRLYAIETNTSTSITKQYIYVKKLSANQSGLRPYYTDRASVYYYGTYITGTRFDGNFKGLSGALRDLNGSVNLPTEFDSPTEFAVNGNIVSGWKAALQHMREGERWMVYIPYESAYGKSDSGTVPAYSLLCFDMIIDKVKRQ